MRIDKNHNFFAYAYHTFVKLVLGVFVFQSAATAASLLNPVELFRPSVNLRLAKKPGKKFYSSLATSNQPSRKLILIAQDWTRSKDPPLSLGHASILTNLRKHQVDVVEQTWAVNAVDFSPYEVSHFILSTATNSQTDVALGAFVWNERSTQIILDDLKKNQFPGRIILGGPQVSYVKKGIETFYPQVDVFIRGYAETALLDFMKSDVESMPSIKGVHYAKQSDVGASSIADLDELPSPFLSGLIQPQRFIRWETQRGCPFRCAFCQHRESDISTKRRQFILSRILQEAEWITQNPIIQDVAVLDPIFNSGSHYLTILDELIKGKFTGKIAFQSRAEMVKDEFLDKICKLNETAEVVLEFGLQTTNREEQALIDRPNNMVRVVDVLTKVRQRQIKTEVSLIFGLPKQTISSFKQSIEFCHFHKVPIIHAFPLMLLRGTPLYEQKMQLGLIESTEIASAEINRVQIDIPHVISSPSFTYEEWKEMAKLAESLEKENKSAY